MSRETPSDYELRKLRSIADYQFGKGSGEVLFSDEITIERSKATKRIRFIYLEDERICSFRVQDGFLIPSLLGGKILYENNFANKVKVLQEAEPFVRKGKSLFAKHVIEADLGISAKEEVILINEHGDFIGIGTSKLSANLMLEMQNGVAVDTRKGVGEKK